MSKQYTEITPFEFVDEYDLIKNAVDNNSGKIFNLSQNELQFIEDYGPAHVWTFIRAEDFSLWLVSGYFISNRVFYGITKQAVPDGMTIAVKME